MASFLSHLVFLSLALLVSANGFTVPLKRVHRSPGGLLAPGHADVPVGNSHDFSSVGGQKLGVILDTGSSDLWVVSSNCTGIDCSGVAKYNATSSLSLSSYNFKLAYLIGTVSGSIGFETITLGSYQITAQVFAIANETRGLNLSSAGNSGIMGLSFPLSAAIPATAGKTILENMFAYFDDAHRFFAFRLGRSSDDSTFSFGQLDSLLSNSTDDFTRTAVYTGTGRHSTLDYWKLPLHAITLNSSTSISSFTASRVPGSPTPIAVLDTGTTFILGPTKDVDAFWAAVGASRKLDSGQWEVQCTRAVAVGFVLGDEHTKREYVIDPEDVSLAEGSPEEGWCTGGIQASDGVNSGDWILGDAFLRVGSNVYVTHHGATAHQPPQIGLLNLTDPHAALARFQSERGHDDEDPITGHPQVYSHQDRTHLNAPAICGIVLVSAFIVGALVSLVAQWYMQHRYNVRKDNTMS
ncbi:acid protease [Dentipellis sp. KUC8613]|nr:acid protease [Dentipellis sp. KUC8613]